MRSAVQVGSHDAPLRRILLEATKVCAIPERYANKLHCASNSAHGCRLIDPYDGRAPVAHSYAPELRSLQARKYPACVMGAN